MRFSLKSGLLLSVGSIFLLSSIAQAQFRGRMSPEDQFNNLVSSYGGSGNTLDLARIPPDQRERLNRMAQFTGQDPLPTSGMMTKDQFMQRSEDARSRMMNNRGGGGAPGGFGGPPGGGFGGPRGGDSSSSSGQPQVYGGQAYGGQSNGQQSNSSSGGSNITDEQVRNFMERSDKDKDGRLSYDEASSTLKSKFQEYDTNRDGYIDFQEYRRYIDDNFANRGRSSGSNNSSNSNSQQPQQQPYGYGGYGRGQQEEEEKIERPVVYRYGKLPKEVPSWFVDLDTDKDGQIGLYEWRQAGRSTSDFVLMDLNGDGYLTAEEWIRYNKMDIESPSQSERGTSVASGSSRPSSDRGSSSDRGASSDRGGFGSRGGPGSMGGGRPGGGGGPPQGRGGDTSRRNPFTGR